MDLNKLYNKAYDWLLQTGPRFLLGILFLIVGLWLIKVIMKWVYGRLHQKQVDPTAKPFLVSLISVALRVLLVIGVVQFIGFELTMFTALVGAFGVAAGLALSGTLQNFASGVIILLNKPFVVGDNIIAQSLEGTVTSISIFSTLVTTFDNRSVIIPNSKLSNEVIINMSRVGTRRLDMEIKFLNAVDVKQVKAIIDEAIEKCEGILATPKRRIGVITFENDGYKISINVWLEAHGFNDRKLVIQENILEALKASGIKMPGKE